MNPNPQPGSWPSKTGGFDLLTELALDQRSSWNHAADLLWRHLDPELWELTHNPWVVLQTTSRERVGRMLASPEFRTTLEDLVRTRRQAAESPAWFQQQHPESALHCIAYFSMEYMLSESLPIYAGGLGNVAGDQLKAADDLGVPVVAIGLLYQQGYFRQAIDHHGEQLALFPYNDPGQMPITPVRQEDGEWLRIELELPGHSVWLRAWQVRVGKLRLYLLDSNDAANFPVHRAITSELYGGGPDLRLKQCILLGIGGWRLLKALGMDPEIAHLNEGHAAFAILERARTRMDEDGLTFREALTVTRAGNLFTTHTAVAAGFDRFPPELLGRHLGQYCETALRIPLSDLLALGREAPGDPAADFSMACLAVRGSGAINGVSRAHGEVSRQLFGRWFPRWPWEEVPVGHVTNGVHMPTWDSAAADRLWTTVCGKDRWLGTTVDLEQRMRAIPDHQLWQFRIEARTDFVDYVRRRLARQLAASGAPPDEVEMAGLVLDPNVLTLCFARRFVGYKRPNLLLQDRERLIRLLNNPRHPVQLVIAGKAPPFDPEGRAFIREWQEFLALHEVRGRAIFLSDYDIRVSSHLVRGADVWLNTPLRPWEACGTSGMKVLVNGGLNLSVPDGWWEEAFSYEVGWSLDPRHDGGAHHDAADAGALYDLLEHEVIRDFYERDADGVPVDWVRRMRESMARLTPRFSAERTVREYTEAYYLPMSEAYRARQADHGASGRLLEKSLRTLERHLPEIRFGSVRHQVAGECLHCEAQIYLGGIDPDFMRVQLYARPQQSGPPPCLDMQRIGPMVGAMGGYVYTCSVPADRPADDYTVRIIASVPGISLPLELPFIRWQR